MLVSIFLLPPGTDANGIWSTCSTLLLYPHSFFCPAWHVCLVGLRRIVDSLKSVYAYEASDCVSLNLVNASELFDKQERSFKDLSFPEVACNYKLPEGLGIDAFLLGGGLMLLVC